MTIRCVRVKLGEREQLVAVFPKVGGVVVGVRWLSWVHLEIIGPGDISEEEEGRNDGSSSIAVLPSNWPEVASSSATAC